MSIVVRNVSKQFGTFTALDDVSIEVNPGSLTALLGPSGSGKSTLLRVIAGLEQPDSGSVFIDDKNVTGRRPQDRDVGFVFQHYAAFKHMTVYDNVAFGMKIRKRPRAETRARVQQLLELVQLDGLAKRYPSQLSGGQRQRIGLARALATKPKLVIADEPVSALDVSVQAQVINLMQDLQEELGLSYLFVAHDLSIVRHISTRIAVMYLGQIVEIGDAATIYERPLHPYSRALLAAAPRPDPNVRRMRAKLAGDPPSPMNKPSGCPFRTRCPIARPACAEARPPLELRDGRLVACPYSE